MGRIERYITLALVALTIGWFVWFTHSYTNLVQRAEQAGALERTNAALTKQAVERGTTDVKQSEVRAAAKASTASVRASTKKEEQSAQEARPSLSDGQLDRLRRLQAAANAGIHSAE